MNIVSVSTGILRNEANVKVTLTISGVNQLKVTNVNFEVWDSVNHSTYSTSFVMGRGVTTATVTIPVIALPLYNTWYQAMVHIYNSDTQQSRTFPNTFYRDPTPQVKPTITKGWGIIRDEQSRNLGIAYTSNNSNGVCNCYRFIITDHDTQTVAYDRILPLGTHTTGDVSASAIFVVKPTSLQLKTRYEFTIIPGYHYYDQVHNDKYLWGSTNQTYFNDNALFRNPTPITTTAIKDNSPYLPAIYYPNPGTQNEFQAEYTNSQDNGTANGFRFTLLNGSTVVYTVDEDNVGKTGSTIYASKLIGIADIPSQYLGLPLILKIEPYFKDNGTKLIQAVRTFETTFIFSASLEPIEVIAPVSTSRWGNFAVWFKPINTETPKSLRFVVILPIDGNYEYLTPEEQADYKYKRISIDVAQDQVIKSEYITDLDSPNSVLGNIDPVCMGDTLAINLDNLLKTFSYSKMVTVTITVVSPFGLSVSVSRNITFTSFGIEDDRHTLTGQEITAEYISPYLDAMSIIASWTTTNTISIPSFDKLRGSEIKYDVLSNARQVIKQLYDLTKNLNSSNKYVVPMDVVSMDIAPAFVLSSTQALQNKDSMDYVYNNTFLIGTQLEEIYSEPADWETNYNNYFKKDMHYVWRSTDDQFSSGDVMASAEGGYNVFYTYYMLLYEFLADVIDVEPVVDYISGTLVGTYISNASTITDYSFAYLPNLKRLVIDQDVTSLPEHVFDFSTAITELLLLHEGSIVTVSNATTLQPIAGATIKVPSDLISSYQADAIWGKNTLHLTFEAL